MSTQHNPRIFPESRLAHYLLDGLNGLELGASAHNPFGLKTRNVGLRIDGYIQEQIGYCGYAVDIDIEAPAHAIPVPDESEDFIVSSHVLEHCPDLIRSLLEWFRIVRPNGYIFMIVPHRNASSADVGRPLTDWPHICDDFKNDVSATTESDPMYYANQHCHVFTLETLKNFINAIFGARLQLVAEQQKDDKAGNGFTLAYQKICSLAASSPWSIPTADGSALSIPFLSGCDMPSYRVTAVVSTYNSEAFMRGCLENLLQQTLHQRDELEVIVIDSASRENEGAIVQEFQKQSPHIQYIRTAKRETIYRAWNRGCKLASGKYITNANTDDRHRYDALEIMAQQLDTHPDIALVYGDVFVTGLPNQTFSEHIRCGYHARPDYAPEIMLSGCHMGPQPMWRKSVHETIGWFDEQFHSAGDYEFWCRIALHHPFYHIQQFLGLYFENPAGICNSAMGISQEETKKVLRRYTGMFPTPSRSFTTNLQYKGKMTPTGFVNIGIVTFNRLDFTRQAIAALLIYTDYPYVLTVIDNNSQDGTQAYLTSLKNQGVIKNLVLLDENVGVAKASNLAWSLEPTAEYYLKLDNDIVMQRKNWLSEMISAIDLLQGLGALAYNFEPRSYPLVEQAGIRVRLKLSGNLGGACILIPKRTHDVLGYWAEDYGLYGEEDADYCYRITKAGWLLAYMEDENAGIHLPAGKAAKIDTSTFEARDGKEEIIHANYRLFKDKQRRKNIKLRDTLYKIYDSEKGSLFKDTSMRSSILLNHKNKVATQHNNCRPVISFNIYTTKYSTQYLRKIAPLLKLSELNTIELLDGNKFIKMRNGQAFLDTSEVPEDSIFFLQRDFSDYEFLLQLDYKIIYDIDDNLLEVPENHPDKIRYEYLAAFLKKYLHRFDIVTVPNEELKKELSTFNSNIHVIPNFIPFIPTAFEQEKTKVRILISGAPSHLADVEFLIPVIAKICLKYTENVEFIFWGFFPKSLSTYSNVGHVSTFVQDYPTYLNELNKLQIDIGLIPLAVTRFNSFKSDLKWKEYAICNIASLVSDTIPYQTIRNNIDGILLKNDPELWESHLLDLIENKEKRTEIALKARTRVESCFLLENNLEYLLKTIKTLQTTKETPDVSIIIPVYNKKNLTYNCITTLLRITRKYTYEIIVVDNASTDGTHDLIKSSFKNCTLISNSENYGFAKACNQGAQQARSDQLVFLNNDTIPQSDWLEELVTFLEAHPEAGIVGCKLLYPDETIQHCGASMNYDGSYFRHQYKFLHKDHPLVNSARELDAVTAACFLTPRKIFFELGMFDENYLNGCEDMDYCSKVKSAGYKIYYNPKSVLFHQESQTPRPGNRDRENFALYLSKWGTAYMKNEIEIYAEDGFWSETLDGVYKKAPNTYIKECMLAIKKASQQGDKHTLAKLNEIISRIYPVEEWSKSSLPNNKKVTPQNCASL